MGQCQSVIDGAIYTPPLYTEDDIQKAIASNNIEYITQLHKLLEEDDMFRSHRTVLVDVIPALGKGIMNSSYKKEKDLNAIDILLFKCMIEITRQVSHVRDILSTTDEKLKLIKKLVDNITYRKDLIQTLSCMILANLSNVDCVRLAETTLPAFIKTSLKKNIASTHLWGDLEKAAMVIMGNLTKLEGNKYKSDSNQGEEGVEEEDIIIIGGNRSNASVLNKMNEMNTRNRDKQIQLASGAIAEEEDDAVEAAPPRSRTNISASIKAIGTLVMPSMSSRGAQTPPVKDSSASLLALSNRLSMNMSSIKSAMKQPFMQGKTLAEDDSIIPIGSANATPFSSPTGKLVGTPEAFAGGMVTEALKRISPTNSPNGSPGTENAVNGAAKAKSPTKRKSLGLSAPRAKPAKPPRTAVKATPSAPNYHTPIAPAPPADTTDGEEEVDVKKNLNALLSRGSPGPAFLSGIRARNAEVEEEDESIDAKKNLGAFLSNKMGGGAPFLSGIKARASVGRRSIDGTERGLSTPAVAAAVESTEETVMLKDHKTYGKYFYMLTKLNQSKDLVAHKMKQDDENPLVLDRSATDRVPISFRMAAATKPVKQVSQSTIKKKKFYWGDVDHSQLGDDSLWKEEAEEPLTLDEIEFNKLFVEDRSAVKAPLVDATPSEHAEVSKKKEKVLDAKRSQGGNIALARIKVPREEIRKSIELLEDDTFSCDQLKNLALYLPTVEEAAKLQAYRDDSSSLDVIEKYMLTMLDFPTASMRITCLLFKGQHRSKLSSLHKEISVIESACDDVKLSVQLKKVLKTILRVGNQMNDATKIGFSMDSLLKLRDTKALDQKTSLLHYVISIIHKNDPAALNFSEDLKNIPSAVKLPLEVVMTECAAYQKECIETLNKFQQVYDMDSPNPQNKEHESALTKLEAAFAKAKADMEEIATVCTSLREKYAGVLSYFGENPKLASEDFFKTLNSFIIEFNTTKDAYVKVKTAEEKKLAKDAVDVSKRSSTVVKSSTLKSSSTNSTTPGSCDAKSNRFSARV